ncbi:MAG TPA: HipA domain-containing protein [Gammaproteobacteria bacterium]|jgi:serine/threonine-protein kinase HipA|nr:HipA domain-containing protein [Gammaproteobacteria bacterium]
MATALWGKVYYKDTYAGRLQEEPGGRIIFTYDSSYLEAKLPAIAYTLPLRMEPFLSEYGLHPFFDNLVAEGWFRNAQAKALGINPNHRFALLLGFGYDLAGAVSVIDPEPQHHHQLDHTDEATLAALLGRASISGVQRKLLVVQEGKAFRPVRPNELSTHIAKLASGNLNHILELEYLTTLAVSKLLSDDDVVEMEIITIPAIHEQALIIPRFDRSATGKRLHHFEEFNQLLGKSSGDDKYNGSYEEMGRFILNTPGCMPAEADKLFHRILACLLVGNTDAHFKNFAMFHIRDGLRLTPLYDLVASSIYPEYQAIALDVCGVRNMAIGRLDGKHLIRMGEGFGVKAEIVVTLTEILGKQLPKALAAVEQSSIGTSQLRKKLLDKMEKRWNGSFALTGQRLLKKRSSGGKSNG